MADITTWPWPRFIQTEFRTFHIGILGSDLILSEAAYYIGAYWGLYPILNLGTISEVDDVTIADFNDFIIVSTIGYDSFNEPVRRMFIRDLTKGYGYIADSFITATEIICATVFNNNGQFLGANIQSDPNSVWPNLNSRSIIWSAIGDYELDPNANVQAGSIHGLSGTVTRQHPQIFRITKLGDNLLAYGDIGIVILTPTFSGNIFTYGTRVLPNYGIRSSTHIAGDNTIQCFIDSTSDLWQIETGNRVTKRGYKEFIQPMIDSGLLTIMSFLPRKRRFYISNGVSCLIVNEFGAYHAHQLVSSIIQTPDGIFATWKDSADYTAYITTDGLDFNTRGFKSVESIECNMTTVGVNNRIRCAVDWKNPHNGSYVRSGLRLTDPFGRVGIHVAADSFRVHAISDSYTNLELNGFLINVKFSDARYRRGTSPRGQEQ